MFSLGPMGQMPSVSTYTLLTLIFPIKEEPAEKYVISTLQRAANEIVQAYPWLAGQVVVKKAVDDSTSSGLFKIVKYERHDGENKFVHMKDCKKLCPTFDDIVAAKAPTSMLDGTIISPAYGFANFYPSNVEMPVTFVQANFIQGGLLLTIATHHNVMDANGNEQFIQQFASLCRGEALSREDIRIGNSDQDTIMPPIEPNEEAYAFAFFRCPSSLATPAGTWPPPPSANLWKTFRFSHTAVAALKSQASVLCPTSEDIKYISSNDAVTAFIWQRIAAVRAGWISKDSTTKLVRAVNGRRRLKTPIPAAYMGHAVLCCYTVLPLFNVLGDLSSTAIAARRSLLEVDDHRVRSFFHLLQTEKDKTTIAYGAGMDPETDIMITSFVAQGLYGADFGEALGLPVCVRRPQLPDARGLFYLMPLTREGDVDLVAGLSKEEFKGLMGDEKWTGFAEFIG